MKGIRVSERYGVNPAIPLCFFCNEPKNELILTGRLPGDAEAPQNKVWDKRPCDKCAGYMKLGIILISVRNGESGDNPYRTGRFCVIKEEAFRDLFSGAEDALRRRVAFVEDETWALVGLPM